MKESCAAVASVITADDFTAPVHLVEKVGGLLITALTSLKHAGAAFAARDALQVIATTCLTSPKEESNRRLLPANWANRLLNEISTSEKVRDSTLRRSTGYALGFVALMRAEISAKNTPLSICPLVLRNILLFAQPPHHELAESFDRLNLSDKSSFNPSDFFYANSEMSPQADVKNGDYEVNSSFGPIPCYVSRPCNSKAFLVFHQRRRLVAEFMHSIFYDSLFSTHRSLLRFNLISATPF